MALPPTSSKLSSDANEVTTFKFDFPNFTGTHTGTLVSLNVNSAAGGGTGVSSLTANNVILGNGTSPVQFVAPGISGNVLTSNGTTWVSSPASSGGTVTSVALADGSTSPIFSISGSPVTSSGTLTETLVTQSANKIFAGPTSGAAAQPTFRSLVAADLPSGSSAFVTYQSSQVTTDSTGLSVGSFTTFSNSPALTFTPTITGTYSVYASVPLDLGTGTVATIRIFNTSGSATLMSESQAENQSPSATGFSSSVFVESVYTLTAGTAYQFDIQGKVTGTALIQGSVGNFYMFARGIGLATSSPTGSYAQAHFSFGSTWITTSTSFTDPTNSGGNTLTVRQFANIILTAASSNVCGITFTPVSSSAVYMITASIIATNQSLNGQTYLQLTDGTTVITSGGQMGQDASTSPGVLTTTTLSGIYAPGTTSPVTVKVQMASDTSGHNALIESSLSGVSPVEWTVLRIA